MIIHLISHIVSSWDCSRNSRSVPIGYTIWNVVVIMFLFVHIHDMLQYQQNTCGNKYSGGREHKSMWIIKKGCPLTNGHCNELGLRETHYIVTLHPKLFLHSSRCAMSCFGTNPIYSSYGCFVGTGATIAPVPRKWPWKIRVSVSHRFKWIYNNLCQHHDCWCPGCSHGLTSTPMALDAG